MPESPKAELVFTYDRHEGGVYEGGCVLARQDDPCPALPIRVVLERSGWVQFVAAQIRMQTQADAVSFKLRRPDGSVHVHRLDRRTVEQIRAETLASEDLIL